MYKNKTFLAIVPARGGSKRLPRKNILDLAGKPLIVWSIEAGLKSKYIDKVLVTSDDNEILEIADHSGCNTIKRPTQLASDLASTYSTVKHILDHSENYDYIVLLQPTSPLRTAQHINEAIELLDQKQADAVISVCVEDHSPLWSNTIPNDGSMTTFLSEELKNKRSQDLNTYYRLNGAIYICKKECFLKEKSFFLKDKIYAYIMNKKSSVDIDDEIDFEFAKTLMAMDK